MRSSWSAGADDEGGTSTRRAETRGKKAPVVRRKGTGSTKSEFLFPAYRPVCSQRGCLSGKVSRAQKDREERELFGCPKTRYTPRSPPAPKRRRLEKSLLDASSRLNSVETPDCWSEILTRVCAGMLCCARLFRLTGAWNRWGKRALSTFRKKLEGMMLHALLLSLCCRPCVACRYSEKEGSSDVVCLLD